MMVFIPFVYLFSSYRRLSKAIINFLLLNLSIGSIWSGVQIFLEVSNNKKFPLFNYISYDSVPLFPSCAFTYVVVFFARKAIWNYTWMTKSDPQKLQFCRKYWNPCCNLIYDDRRADSTNDCLKFQSYGEKFYSYYLITTIFMVIFFLLLIFLNSIWCSAFFGFYQRCKYKCLPKEAPSYEQFMFATGKRQSKASNIISLFPWSDWDEDQIVPLRLRDLTEEKPFSEHKLTVDKLSVIFDRMMVVKGVEFVLREGECLGLLGLNGAGKSSTFNALTAKYYSYEADVTIHLDDKYKFLTSEVS